MTEYDYSPEGYQRYLDTQRRISKWVQNTNAHSSEFRSPFGTFHPVRTSEVSSNNRTLAPTPSTKPRGDRNMIERGRGRDERERRNSMSAATFRQSELNAGYHAQQSPIYTSRMRHSYPYSPDPQESQKPTRTAHAVPESHRRAQSLSSRPSQSQTQIRTHHHIPSNSTARASRSHGSPRRRTTLPAYVAATPQQSSSRTHSTHRPSTHRSHNHHHDSRSQSTPRSSSKLGSPLAVSPVYAVVGNRAYVADPGGYVLIPAKVR